MNNELCGVRHAIELADVCTHPPIAPLGRRVWLCVQHCAWEAVG